MRCRIGRISKEPDGSFTPIALNDGEYVDTPVPTLVIEVAHIESLTQLKVELRNWISDCATVQVAIGVKIFQQPVGEARLHRMLALVYQRGHAQNPVQEVEFGTDIGNAVEGREIRILLADLYRGVPIPAGVKANTTLALDLGELQATILSSVGS
jgi:hypothetical protein